MFDQCRWLEREILVHVGWLAPRPASWLSSLCWPSWWTYFVLWTCWMTFVLNCFETSLDLWQRGELNIVGLR